MTAFCSQSYYRQIRGKSHKLVLYAGKLFLFAFALKARRAKNLAALVLDADTRAQESLVVLHLFSSTGLVVSMGYGLHPSSTRYAGGLRFSSWPQATLEIAQAVTMCHLTKTPLGQDVRDSKAQSCFAAIR